MKPILFFLCALCIMSLEAQETSALDFRLLRQNDDVSVLESKEEKSLYERFKLNTFGNGNSLSFGGSYRFQTEAFINEQFDADDNNETDAWLLNRFMLHAHLKLGKRFELFGELNSSVINSKQNIIPVDKDELSVNQLFAKYHINDHWNILLGRQNMRMGSGRLIDIREGPNVRLSFDMIQVQCTDENTMFTAFYAIPVQQQAGIFDNDFLQNNEALGALYWTQNWTQNTHTDFYLLHKTEEQKTWNRGTADDNRTSLGLRHFGTWKGLKYNNEFVYQMGSFGDQDIRAWTASFNIEKEFSFGTIGLKTEAISGDDNNDNTLNTFDGLYPRGAYFGRVARFGPSNLLDIHPYFDKKIGDFNLELDYVAFWRFSKSDGIYGPPLILDYPAINDQRFIGHQLGGILAYEMNPSTTFELESNIIFPGNFLSESGLSDTLYHFVFTAEFRF